MARPLRRECAGALSHVTARGNERRNIFLGNIDDDREAFIDLLTSTYERFRWICHAYCLMTNHYNLLRVHSVTSHYPQVTHQENES